jgi:molybdopterin converting factor small subunit
MAVVTVHVPSALRELTQGRPSLEIEASSLDEALERLRKAEPLLAGRLFADDGSLRGFVNLFLDGADVRGLASRGASIESDAELAIVPSVAGG